MLFFQIIIGVAVSVSVSCPVSVSVSVLHTTNRNCTFKTTWTLNWEYCDWGWFFDDWKPSKQCFFVHRGFIHSFRVIQQIMRVLTDFLFVEYLWFFCQSQFWKVQSEYISECIIRNRFRTYVPKGRERDLLLWGKEASWAQSIRIICFILLFSFQFWYNYILIFYFHLQ
jgi:hypothetical protein